MIGVAVVGIGNYILLGQEGRQKVGRCLSHLIQRILLMVRGGTRKTVRNRLSGREEQPRICISSKKLTINSSERPLVIVSELVVGYKLGTACETALFENISDMEFHRTIGNI